MQDLQYSKSTMRFPKIRMQQNLKQVEMVEKFFKVQIYALTDFDDNIFYIGCTIGLLSKRLKQHLSSARMKWKNSKKIEMIRKLDYKIRIKKLYGFGVYATDGKDVIKKSSHVENRWIRKHRNKGVALCNGYRYKT